MAARLRVHPARPPLPAVAVSVAVAAAVPDAHVPAVAAAEPVTAVPVVDSALTVPPPPPPTPPGSMLPTLSLLSRGSMVAATMAGGR